MKSLAMSPSRKYPIQNQDINILENKRYQSLTPHSAKYSPGFKSFINEAEDDRNNYTDTPHTNKGYLVKSESH